MKNNYNYSIEEIIASTIKQSIAEAFRNEKQIAKKEQPIKKIGGIDLAVEVTGLAKQTIYSKSSKGTIPFIKRGGKLYFNREKLIEWIENGNE